MFNKMIFLTVCLITGCLSAQENQHIEKPSQIGKYQISTNDGEIYLLDTETGTIWMAERNLNFWKNPHEPWVQLDSPIQKADQ